MCICIKIQVSNDLAQSLKRFHQPKSQTGLKKEHVPEGVNANLFKQAKVYEIWDKTTRNVYWVAKDFFF